MARKHLSAEEVLELVDNDWDIGGEVCCSYSDDEFYVEDEFEQQEAHEMQNMHEEMEIAELENYELEPQMLDPPLDMTFNPSPSTLMNQPSIDTLHTMPNSPSSVPLTILPVNPTIPPRNPTIPPANPTTILPVNPATIPPGNPTIPPGNPATILPVNPATIPPVNPATILPGNLIIPPMNPTIPPVNPTIPQGNPTTPPGIPTIPPVNPTIPPGNPTIPPGIPTIPPVNPTIPPGNPTIPSSVTTSPLMGNTSYQPAITVAPTQTKGQPTSSLPSSLLGIFQLLVSPSLFQVIADNTNLYAKQILDADKYSQYVPVTVPEISAYFGFMILMGINKLPSLFHYWKSDTTRFDPIASRITRTRFLEISRFLHFTDNSVYNVPSTDPRYDRIWKVRPVIDALSTTFVNAYVPHDGNAIDEAMIPFKGRSSLKQYIPLKPIRRGIKVWVRADSKNGYVPQFQVYVGKTGGVSEKHLGERVVKDLTRSIVGQNYTIYCDNYFSSPKLFTDLLNDGIYACGTLRSNRLGYPEEFKQYLKKGLGERGKSLQKQDGPILFSLWQDNKVVSALSTGCQMGEGIAKRRQRDGSRNDVKCPHNIIEYNKNMGGVDRNDQLRRYYCVRLKSRKMYKYIFWFCFELAVTNTYVLSRFSHTTRQNPSKFVDFRLELAKQLISDYNSRKQRGRPSLPSYLVSRPKISSSHYPSKSDKRSKCHRCYQKKKMKYTYWRCQECGYYYCHTGHEDTDCFFQSHS